MGPKDQSSGDTRVFAKCRCCEVNVIGFSQIQNTGFRANSIRRYEYVTH